MLLSAATPEDLQALDELLDDLPKQNGEAKPAAVEGPKWVAKTLGEVAEFFGLSVQTVKQWRIETPPMPGAEGCWPLKEITAWRHAKLASSPTSEAKRKQDLELGAIQLEQKRLDLAIARRDLVERRDVELWLSTACIEFREMTMALPEMLATNMPPEIRDFVREESDRQCRASLIALQRRLESMDEVASDPVSDTAGADKVG